ncbi:MBL fold metallo-hydrolase [Clostridiaceae bacterium Marseille-Q4145]|nr:MBL fold metallo-hydrolase [Clostridiaceae bacterium Marseille-Q4145]
MEKKRIIAVGILLAALAAVWLGVRQLSGTEQITHPALTITALPVGKADALILKTDDWAAMIDTGEERDGSYIRETLEAAGIDHLNLLLVTHFDKDHVGSAAELLGTVGADQVLMPDYEGTRPEYAAFLSALEAHPETEVQRITGTETLEIPAGSVNTSLTIYAADDPAEIRDTDGEYDNDMSLVAKVTCGEKQFLFTGDIEKTRIRQMLESQVDWKADWIKMPHHGRYQKKVEKLLEAVNPFYAVICDGGDQLAEEETLDALKKRQIKAWETADGTVVTMTDGKNIKVRQENE